MKDVTWKLATTQLPGIDEPGRPFFRDVWDHVQRAAFRLAGLRDIAAGVVETNGLLEQQRQGVTTRQLPAWAALLAVPTAIADIFGTNFLHMPALHFGLDHPSPLPLFP